MCCMSYHFAVSRKYINLLNVYLRLDKTDLMNDNRNKKTLHRTTHAFVQESLSIN